MVAGFERTVKRKGLASAKRSSQAPFRILDRLNLGVGFAKGLVVALANKVLSIDKHAPNIRVGVSFAKAPRRKPKGLAHPKDIFVWIRNRAHKLPAQWLGVERKRLTELENTVLHTQFYAFVVPLLEDIGDQTGDFFRLLLGKPAGCDRRGSYPDTARHSGR